MTHLADMEFPESEWPRSRLIENLRRAMEYLKGNAIKIERLEDEVSRLGGAHGMLEAMQADLETAKLEAEHWKEIADSLEFGDDKPDMSPPPRADGI